MKNIAEKIVSAIDRAISGTPPENAAKKVTAPDASAQGGMYEAASGSRRTLADEPQGRSPELDPRTGRIREQTVEAPKPQRDLSRVPHADPRQQAAFIRHCREQGFTVPKDAIVALNELAGVYEKFVAGLSEYSSDAAVAAYHAQLQSIGDRIAKGDTTVAETDSWSLDDWRDDYSSRMSVCHNRLTVLEQKAKAVALPVYEAFGNFLDGELDKLEVALVQESEKWASPYAAPPWLWIARKFAEVCRTGMAVPSGNPRALLNLLTT